MFWAKQALVDLKIVHNVCCYSNSKQLYFPAFEIITSHAVLYLTFCKQLLNIFVMYLLYTSHAPRGNQLLLTRLACLNTCSDWPKAVFGSGHPITEIKTAFAGIF